MIAASDVSAVIVTRGDVDITKILDSLPFDDVIVWNNSATARDWKVLGRYLGCARAKNQIVYVQDDDCVVPVQKLLREYSWGERLANMDATRCTEYPDSSLVGWGALFPAVEPLPVLFTADWTDDELYRCCDVIFTTLRPFRRVHVGHDNLPWATGPGRMYTADTDHMQIRRHVLHKARELR